MVTQLEWVYHVLMGPAWTWLDVTSQLIATVVNESVIVTHEWDSWCQFATVMQVTSILYHHIWMSDVTWLQTNAMLQSVIKILTFLPTALSINQQCFYLNNNKELIRKNPPMRSFTHWAHIAARMMLHFLLQFLYNKKYLHLEMWYQHSGQLYTKGHQRKEEGRPYKCRVLTYCCLHDYFAFCYTSDASDPLNWNFWFPYSMYRNLISPQTANLKDIK